MFAYFYQDILANSNIGKKVVYINIEMFLFIFLNTYIYIYIYIYIIESIDSINRDERGFPLTQYITNGGISRARNTITHIKHHHHVLRRISNRMSV